MLVARHNVTKDTIQHMAVPRDGTREKDELKGKCSVHFEFIPLTNWQQFTLSGLKILIIRGHFPLIWGTR
jgi:hypothetical protein